MDLFFSCNTSHPNYCIATKFNCMHMLYTTLDDYHFAPRTASEFYYLSVCLFCFSDDVFKQKDSCYSQSQKMEGVTAVKKLFEAFLPSLFQVTTRTASEGQLAVKNVQGRHKVVSSVGSRFLFVIMDTKQKMIWSFSIEQLFHGVV